MVKIVRVSGLSEVCGGLTIVQMEDGRSFTVDTTRIKKARLVQGSRLKLTEAMSDVSVYFGGVYLATLKCI
jgi:hypothetical protein